jgi:hypothetical protein
VANQASVRFRDQRQCQFAGRPQRVDDVLLGVAGMPGIQEGSARHRLDHRHIRWLLASDLNVHRPRCLHADC